MLGTLSTKYKIDWKSHIAAMTHACNCTKNASTNFSPYILMFGRHPRLPINVAFGIHSTSNKVAFSKSRYVDRLKKRLDYAYDKARSFQKKEVQRTKQRYDRKAKFILLEPNEVVLVRKMPHTEKHKIHNRWEDEECIIVSQPSSAIPVYIVQPVVGGKQRTLHRNLLHPLVYKLNEVEDSDEEIEMPSPVEVKRSFERVRKQIKVDQIDKSIAIVSEPLIDHSDTSSTRISKESPMCPETNDDVQESILESFDSEREISPVTIVSKCPKPNLPIDISKPQESLNVTEMIKQAPSVRDYSTKGELTQLIKQEEATLSGKIDSTQPFTQSLTWEPLREGESFSAGKSVSDQTQEFNVAGSSKIGNIQSTQEARDKGSDSESHVPIRRSKRRNIGAPPTRYGTVVFHKFIVCPTISWLLNIVDPVKLLQWFYFPLNFPKRYCKYLMH